MITLCILIFLFASFIEADCEDKADIRRHDYEISERRHKELLSEVQKKRTRKVTRRRIVKQGDVTLGEEITEEEE